MLVMTRTADILKANRASWRLLGKFVLDPTAAAQPPNVLRSLFDPRLVRPFVVDWERTARLLLSRMHRESLQRPSDGPLAALLEDAGFTDVEVTEVELSRRYDTVAEMVEESADVSPSFSSTFGGLTADQQAEVAAHMAAGAARFTDADGHVTVPGVSLVARADA